MGATRSTPRGSDVDSLRRRRLRRRNLIDTSKATGYVFKVGDTREELESALRVVYTCYRQFGLVATSPSGVRVTFHHLLPDTRVLVAKKDGNIHSTLTMVVDSVCGLPMEHEFADSLQPLRDSGAYLAEITSLATLAEYRQLNLFMYLYKLLLLIGRGNRLTDFVLVINPKHVRFYRDILLFEQIGPERPYGAVRHAPGVPFRMNIERTLSEGRRIYAGGKVQQDLYDFFSSPWESGQVSPGSGLPPDETILRFFFGAMPAPLDNHHLQLLAALYRDTKVQIDWQTVLGASNPIISRLRAG